MNETRDSDLALRTALSRLPRSIEPPRDLWAGIEQQIAVKEASGKKGRTVGVRWAIAASVTSLAVGVLVTLSMQRQPPVTAQSANPGSMPSSAVATPAMGQAGYSFVPASTDAVRQKLRADVAVQLANLPPATREKVESNLLLIKNAVADIQSALTKDPGNALLQDLLVTTYQNELDTLANVQALTRSSHPEVST